MSTSLAIQPKTDQAYKPLTTGRLPVLDGWRGVAILLVLFDHLQAALLGRYLQPWTQTGQHGVTIFFVLSGYLITSSLIKGPINLRHFYTRRAFRLLPVAWTYLGALVLLDLISRTHLSSGLKASLLFYRNFVGQEGDGMTGHFWSLSLEEQFYLVWPLLLLIAGLRFSKWLAAAGIFSCALYRWMNWAHYNHNILNGRTQVRADALLAGCLLALLLSDQWRLKWHILDLVNKERWRRVLTASAFAVLLFCMARFHWLPPLSENIAIAALMAASLLHPIQILSARWLTYVGKVSYSVYVWQELLMGTWPGWTHFFVLCFGLPLLALGSYYLIERPCTELGRRISR